MKEIDPVFSQKPDEFIVGVWCITIPAQPCFPNAGTFVQMLSREGEEGVSPWRLTARTSSFHPEDRFTVRFEDTRDVKSVKEFTLPPSPQRDAENLALAALLRAKELFKSPDKDLREGFFRVEGTQEKMIYLTLKKRAPKWWHMKKVGKRDAREVLHELEKKFGPKARKP